MFSERTENTTQSTTIIIFFVFVLFKSAANMCVILWKHFMRISAKHKNHRVNNRVLIIALKAVLWLITIAATLGFG